MGKLADGITIIDIIEEAADDVRIKMESFA